MLDGGCRCTPTWRRVQVKAVAHLLFKQDLWPAADCCCWTTEQSAPPLLLAHVRAWTIYRIRRKRRLFGINRSTVVYFRLNRCICHTNTKSAGGIVLCKMTSSEKMGPWLTVKEKTGSLAECVQAGEYYWWKIHFLQMLQSPTICPKFSLSSRKPNNSDTQLTVKNIMALSWLASEQMIIATNTFLPAPIISHTSEQLRVLSHSDPYLWLDKFFSH